jgi:hypothetical protein
MLHHTTATCCASTVATHQRCTLLARRQFRQSVQLSLSLSRSYFLAWNMANFIGGPPHWTLPQDAALQAQQAYQQQAAGVGYIYPPSSASVPAPPIVGPSPAAVTPPLSGNGPPSGSRNDRLARMEDRVLITRTADEETEDGRIRNKEAMAKIRDAWVYKEIRARMDEFTEYKQVCITICCAWGPGDWLKGLSHEISFHRRFCTVELGTSMPKAKRKL